MKQLQWFAGRIVFWLGAVSSLWAQQAGLLDAGFDPGSGADRTVQTIVAQADGRLLVGGSFTRFANQSRPGLVRLEADGSLDASFAPTFLLPTDGGVFALAQQPDGKILAGGYFSNVSNSGRRTLVRLNTTGTVDTTFNANFPTESAVFALALAPDGSIYAAGIFEQVGGSERLCVVRLRPNGTVDTTFRPPSTLFAIAVDLAVTALAVQPDGKLLVGGTFVVPMIGDRPQYNGLVRLNTDGSVDTTFNPDNGLDANVGIAGFALNADGSLYLGGYFPYGNPGEALRRFTADGRRDPAFAPVFAKNGGTASVYSFFAEADGRMVVAGDFTHVNGVARPSLARVLPDGTLDSRFASLAPTDVDVSAVTLDRDRRIVIGGDFSTVQGVARSRVARLLNPALPPLLLAQPVGVTVSTGANVSITAPAEPVVGQTYQWFKDGVALQGETSATLYRVAVQASETYYVEVTNAVGTVRSEAATISVIRRVAGWVDRNFAPAPITEQTWTPPADYTFLAAYPDGRLLVRAGDLPIVLVRLLSDGRREPGFRVELSDAPQRAWVLADGSFLLSTSGSTSPRLRRYSAGGVLDTSFALKGWTDVTVRDVQPLSDGRILVAGSFGASNPAGSYGLIRVNAQGDTDTTFLSKPGAFGGSGVSEIELWPGDGRILVSGFFTTVDGVARPGLARLLADGSLDTSFVPEGGGELGSSAAVSPDGFVYLGAFDDRGLRRLRSDGSYDPLYSLSVGRAVERRPGQVLSLLGTASLFFQRDGKLIITGINRVNGGWLNPPVRISTNGVIDDTFEPATRVPLVKDGSGSMGPAGHIVAEVGGRLIVTGEFTELGGVTRPGLAALYRDATGSSRLVNLSSRGVAGEGERALIAGFVREGQASHAILLRGVGPALAARGVAKPLQTARLGLYDAGTLLQSVTGWPDSLGTVFSRLGAAALVHGAGDAAVWTTLTGPLYTMHVTPADGVAEGVALVEVFDDGLADNSVRLLNLSTRAAVETGEKVLIAGFVVTGNTAKQVLVRAVGPTLAGYGVARPLADPRLTVYSQGQVIASNDDWGSNPEAGFVAAAARQSGAAALPTGSKDASLLMTLDPGAYTVIVEPASGEPGIGLVEVFEISR